MKGEKEMRTKSDFLIAITQLSAEKNLPKEVILEAVEAALVSTYKKDNLTDQDISVKINPATGEVRVHVQKTVVEDPTDSRCEVSLSEALRLKRDTQIGDTIEVEVTPINAGRIAAQTAKQVVLQRLREAEKEAVFEEFADKEGGILSGGVNRIEPRQIIVDLGRAEAILPASEQVKTERYRPGQRIKVHLIEVQHASKGPQLVVSRTHRNLLKRLLELEVPEIHDGTVELKSIAREGGYRSKVAVSTRQQGLDPVGSCVGLRGIRIQNIVNELNGEKIDIIEWNPDPATFIASALSPAQVISVDVDEHEKAATVVVPDRHLSLAIGREGQNARLAAKLTGWRIDIKSQSAAEEDKAQRAAIALEEIIAEEPPPLTETEQPVLPDLTEEATIVEEAVEPLEEAEPLVPIELAPGFFGEETPPRESIPIERPQIRFAEDIIAPRSTKPDTKEKKSSKTKAPIRNEEKEGTRPKKPRQAKLPVADEEEYAEY